MSRETRISVANTSDFTAGDIVWHTVMVRGEHGWIQQLRPHRITRVKPASLSIYVEPLTTWESIAWYAKRVWQGLWS